MVARTVQIAIVYDTSYLLNNPPVQALNFQSKNAADFPFGIFFNETWEFRFTHYVAEEIRQEIAAHYKNEEKRQKASHARKMLAALLQIDRCEICDLANDAKAVVVDKLLGADSPTDRLLLGFALSLEKKFELVCLATDDGGLMLDVATLRNQGKTTIQTANAGCLTSVLGKFVREHHGKYSSYTLVRPPWIPYGV